LDKRLRYCEFKELNSSSNWEIIVSMSCLETDVVEVPVVCGRDEIEGLPLKALLLVLATAFAFARVFCNVKFLFLFTSMISLRLR